MGSVRVEPLGQLVPGPASAGVDCLKANNNLDLARTGGRTFLAWRTAPSHFASAHTRIEVASTEDPPAGPWRHETTFAVGADLREPRFVVSGGDLHLFCMELGTDPRRFQPRRVHRLSLLAGGGPTGGGRREAGWEPPAVALEEPVVPWRIRRLQGRWVLLTYRGAEQMYSLRPADPVVEARVSDDLLGWGPPVVVHVGGTECELVELDDGSLFGVTRIEGPGGAGSDVLAGPSLDALRATPCARKLDSPNVVRWQGRVYCFARRSLAAGGRYDLAPRWVPGSLRIRVNQLLWSTTRKRSSLWRLRAADGGVEWVSDLPSRGDTAFCGVVEDDDGSLLVADYTSPASAGDQRWIRGQLGPTVVNLFRLWPSRAEGPTGPVDGGGG